MKGKVTAESIEMMTDAAWNITLTSLWNCAQLSKNEKFGTRRYIKQFLTNSGDPYNVYLEFTQRILLTREYLIKNEDKYVPQPSKWFDIDNVNGFAGTRRWFIRMEDVRKAFPLYRHQFKALPEAVLEMFEQPTASIFHYWRSWFIEREKQAAANLFLSTIANSIFNSYE